MTVNHIKRFVKETWLIKCVNVCVSLVSYRIRTDHDKTEQREGGREEKGNNRDDVIGGMCSG